MEGQEQHWAETFESDGVTAENRDAFVAANSKYLDKDAAIVGGYNAQKAMGKPFKVPEDMSTLPDDDARADFTSQARKALGITIPKDIEELKDFNFKEGLAEGQEADENLANLVKGWAVEKGIDTATLGKLTSFFNGPLGKFAVQAAGVKAESDKLDAAKTCNEALIADPDLGGEQGVKEKTELLRRHIASKLTAEEYEAVGDALADSIMTKNPVMAKYLLKTIAPLAAEGSTETGGGSGGSGEVKQASPREAAIARWPKSKGQWPEEGTKWEDVSAQTKKALGYKTS